MSRAGKRFQVLKLWLVFVQLYIAASNTIQDDENPGFISIDCGSIEDYTDATTGIRYQTDKDFIESGTNHRISFDTSFNNPYYEPLLRTLRSFPEGDRNCYTLKPQRGRDNNYLIRAIFSYQNYDYKNLTPTFDLYLGANYWNTVELSDSDDTTFKEIAHVSLTDAIHVCLVNTGGGTPFISSLELRPLNNSVYISSLPLHLIRRHDIGTSPQREFPRVRYKDDIYDRLWRQEDFDFWYPLNTTGFETIELQDSAYKLPSEVLETAVRSFNSSYAIKLNQSYDASFKYYVYLHFAEIQQLGRGRKRIVNVDFDGTEPSSETLTLEYLKPLTLISKKPTRGYAHFKITVTAESDVPPILNAFEIYQLVPQPNSPTDAADVNAILEIKRAYGLSNINWQGDPCAPIPPSYSWEGLKCSSDNNPRIVSLNLSSRRLTGEIAACFSNLKKLEFLDLSSNELIGPLPEFLEELPDLKFLNLAGNRLTGSIPKALKEKPNLQLSLDDNPDLCQKGSCKEHEFITPLVASIAVLVVIVIASLVIWRLNRKRLVFSSKFQKKESLKPNNQEFSYADVVSITDSFKTVIGEGAFGKVYLGTLQDGTKVAVKLLSPTSKQGYKEFQSEAQLLMIVHHRNLVSLVGYCNEDDAKALIYEYMDNGDLNLQLSVKNPNVLKWKERVQIAVDAAQGLHYLHNGCKPPIIHRDLKPSNILLNNSMQAKIADFGLSRAFVNERESHLSTQPAGTPGYIDPEFQRSGNLNKKSDIYSFGMILLELITGLPPIRRATREQDTIFILDWTHPKIESGSLQSIVDPRLQADFSTTSAWKIIEIAMSCISPSANQRPDISYILLQLKELMLSPGNGSFESREIYRPRSTSSLLLKSDEISLSVR